jgi:ABC-type uncharacterized transport system fused permease/ATPase subunit
MDSNSQTLLTAHWAAHEQLEQQFLKPISTETALTHLGILHFQGIKALEIADIPLGTRWIFLTGENAFGKTAVLRAITRKFWKWTRSKYSLKNGARKVWSNKKLKKW